MVAAPSSRYMEESSELVERAVLSVCREDGTFFGLPDGTCTTNEAAAREARTEHVRAHSHEDAGAVAALLRRPRQPTIGRPTPARVEAIQRIVQAGLLPASAAAGFIAGECVDDRAWAALRPLVSTLEIPRFAADMWRLRFERLPGGQTLALPAVAFRDEQPEPEYPAVFVGEVRRALAEHLWHLSEATFRYDDERNDPVEMDGALAAEIVHLEGLEEVRFVLVRQPDDQ